MNKISLLTKNINFDESFIRLYESLRKTYSSDSAILESVKGGRFSYICLEPFITFKSKGSDIKIIKEHNIISIKGNPIEELRNLMNEFKIESSAKDLPFFFGGAIGYFGYDLVHFIEKLPKTAKDDLKLPDCYLIFPRKILVLDKKEKNVHIIIIKQSDMDEKELDDIINQIRNLNKGKKFVLNKQLLEDTKKSINSKDIKSNFSLEEYKKVIQKCKDYVLNGDSFQIKISQRLEEDFKDLDAFELYKILREINPSPYSAFLDLEDVKLVSCSPEHLIKLKDGIAETRPIGGTYPRGKNEEDECLLIQKFKNDKKELAEHTMLIDLERNDLGKVCEFGTVRVNELMTIEKYSHLLHIVTNIKGKLDKDKDCFDLFKGMFPGGTITGCPKVRTMEIIDELEPVTRGPYTGSIGFINFNKEINLNITIRTAVICNDKAYIQVGGGIVADSDAEKEYEETIHKGMALVEAIHYLKEIKK